MRSLVGLPRFFGETSVSSFVFLGLLFGVRDGVVGVSSLIFFGLPGPRFFGGSPSGFVPVEPSSELFSPVGKNN